MMNSRFHRIVIALITICLSAATLNAMEKVSASGSAFYEQGRELIAREKALDEAKRQAIEKAMGVSIESKTLMEDYQIIKDQIMTRSSGYLKNIAISKEEKTDYGTYDVTIEAEVEYAILVDDYDRFQKSLTWQKNPRVHIQIESTSAADQATAGKAVNLLSDKLIQNGLKVYDQPEELLHKMGLVIGIVLNTHSSVSEYQDVKVNLHEVSISANVYLPGESKIIAVSSISKSIPGENRIGTLDKGVRICIDSIWKDLRKKVIKIWERELYSEREILLQIDNVDNFQRAQHIKGLFNTVVFGVIDTVLLNFETDSAEYSIRYRGWPEQLNDEIQMNYFRTKYFSSELKKMSTNQMTIVLKAE